MVDKITPHNKPHPPTELLLFNALHARLPFTKQEERHYHFVKKGYSGELKFHKKLQQWLPSGTIPLYDLRFNHRHSEFQIDSLVLFNKSLYLFEVKNYEGDFLLKGNTWHMSFNEREINNPIIQLKRSESLLRQMLEQAGYNYTIKSYVVFINSKFSLFQASFNLPIILASQLQRFLVNLNQKETPVTKREQTLANYLVNLNKRESLFENIPSYTYDDLKKGFVCEECQNFMDRLHLSKLICRQCKTQITIEKAVLLNIANLLLLFPNIKIKCDRIYDWCGEMISKKTIWRILTKHFTLIKNGKYSYYIKK